MSVSSKAKRKIVVGGQIYLWYVAEDDDSAYNVLHIVSDDKRLIIACPLKTEAEYVISKGRVFQKKETNGCWNRYLLPFHIPDSITPKFVEQLIVLATQDTAATPLSGSSFPV